MKPVAIAVVGGAAIVLLDARFWPDPGVPAAFIVGWGLLLGLFFPIRPWRPGLALWATIVLLESVRMVLISLHFPAPLPVIGHGNPYSPSLSNLAVSVIPACASAILGGWITRSLAQIPEVPASE